MLARFIGLALFAILSTVGFAKEGDVKIPMDEVTLEEFKKLVETKGAIIIDANGKDMYDDGHVPGAISFAYDKDKLASLLPKDKNALIVAYCGGPMCTAWQFAAEEAVKLGYKNFKHYKGGIKGWKEAGLPIEKGAKKAS